MKTFILSSLIALAALAPAAVAGGDGLVDYMPLAFFNRWLLQQVNEIDGVPPDPKDLTTIKMQNVRQEGDVTIYAIRSPIFDELTDVVLDFGIEGGTLSIYGARVVTDKDLIDDDGEIDANIPKLKFVDTPVFVADGGTSVSDPEVVTPISTSIKLKLKIGPFSGSAKVDVNGEFGVDWLPVAEAGEGGPPEVRLEIRETLTFTSDDDDLDDLEATSDKTAGVTVSPDLGFTQIDGKGSKSYELVRAILPGSTWTDPGFVPFNADPETFAFPDDPVRLTNITIPGPDGGGLFTLDGQLDADAADDMFVLSNLALSQTLGGKIEVTGDVATAAAPGTTVPIKLKGKAKFQSSTGLAVVSLKGKTKALDLETGTLVLKAKGTLDVGATLPKAEGDPPQLLELAYKAGKTELGEPVEGTLPLMITPITGTEISLDFLGAVDTDLLPKGKSRKLGSEGTLTLGSFTMPIVMQAKLKPAKEEGFPDGRIYKIRPLTSAKPTLAKFAALNVGTGFTFFKVGSKINGAKVKIKESTKGSGLTYTAEDPGEP